MKCRQISLFRLLCLLVMSFFLVPASGFWLASASAQTVGIQPPPPDIEETDTLSSGDTVTFRSRNHITFKPSGEVGIFLIYRTDDLPSGMTEIQAVENRLFANTREICLGSAQKHVDLMVDRFPDINFTVLAVRLQKVIGEQNGLEQFVAWTGVFRLTDGKCGEPLAKPKRR